ncbi:MAG TPA: antitoxin [Prolixibacteraceae bacterium]|nr:antitoxin [Prolixibacteraceae bacterium]
MSNVCADLILEKLAVGDTVENLVDAYPGITKDDIAACLVFAKNSIKNEIIISKAS